jgi:3-methyladenine DNA glycosylase AlkD
MTNNVLREQLHKLADSRKTKKNLRFYRGGDPETVALGVPIGKVFSLAKEFSNLSFSAIREMLEDPHYEIRLAGVAVMDCKARHRNASKGDRRSLFKLYLRRHDRIDNWDLVDRAAPSVIGNYLFDKDRTILYQLAESTNCNKRRTAIVSTLAFIEKGQIAETYRLASTLIGDKNKDVVQAVEYCLREAGKRNENRLVEFLQQHKLGRRAVMSVSSLLPDSAKMPFLY